MSENKREPWSVDVLQRLIPLGIERQALADRLKISRGHLWRCLSGDCKASERTKQQILEEVERLEKIAEINL